MARFDVYRTADGAVVVDCQADLLQHLKTRFVIPLLPPVLEPPVTEKLNPSFLIEDELYVLFPQFAASVRISELKEVIASLADNDAEIIGAIDMLVSGF